MLDSRTKRATTTETETLRICLAPRQAGYILGIALLLTIAHATTYWLNTIHSNNRYAQELFEMFSLDGEGNFPSFFSGLILLAAAALFGVISLGAYSRNRHGLCWYWCGLAIIFSFLSIDEVVQIHEKFDYMLSPLNTSGLLAWPWVIVYGALVLIFIVGYAAFWLKLPIRFQLLFALSAAIYVIGAIGCEMIGAALRTGDATELSYIIVLTVEEVMEMSAIVLLVFTCLHYIDSQTLQVQIRFNRGLNVASRNELSDV